MLIFIVHYQPGIIVCWLYLIEMKNEMKHIDLLIYILYSLSSKQPNYFLGYQNKYGINMISVGKL